MPATHSLIDADRLTLAQVARRLGVHVATVWRWTERGIGGRPRLASLIVGGRRYVLVADLEAWLAEGRTGELRETDAERRERAEAADAALDAAGW